MDLYGITGGGLAGISLIALLRPYKEFLGAVFIIATSIILLYAVFSPTTPTTISESGILDKEILINWLFLLGTCIILGYPYIILARSGEIINSVKRLLIGEDLSRTAEVS